jgi:hypothetical protein
MNDRLPHNKDSILPCFSLARQTAGKAFAMSMLAFAAAAIYFVLGSLHLAYTLHDMFLRPRYFRPLDSTLIEPMRNTHVALARNGRDFWTAMLGFHFSHSLGILLFVLLIAIATLQPIAWLKPLLVLVSALYSLIAWRCWFAIPMWGAIGATLLMFAGWFF